MSMARFVELSLYVSGFVLMAAIIYARPLGNVFDYVLGFGGPVRRSGNRPLCCRHASIQRGCR